MTDRSWIWLAVGCVGVIGVGVVINATGTRFPQLPFLMPCGTLTFIVAGILGLGAFREVWMGWQHDRASLFSQRQKALARTPVVMMAEALRGLHPEAVKALNRFGVKTSWEVRIDAANGGREWTLKGTDIHFGFIEFLLDQSTPQRLYPLNLFSEGSKRWDPEGLVDDREQYRQFEMWMSTRLMVTRPFGNKVAEFIPPWSPQLVKEVMGFESEPDLFRPAPLSASTQTSPQMAKSTQFGGKEKETDVPDLTDEEQAEIRALQEAHTKATRISKEVYDRLPKDVNGHAIPHSGEPTYHPMIGK